MVDYELPHTTVGGGDADRSCCGNAEKVLCSCKDVASATPRTYANPCLLSSNNVMMKLLRKLRNNIH